MGAIAFLISLHVEHGSFLAEYGINAHPVKNLMLQKQWVFKFKKCYWK
jgi:hypothetical protein